MSVKIFKKKPATKRCLVSMLSVVIPFALSSALGCMDLERDSTVITVPPYDQLPGIQFDLKLLEEIPDLLKPSDVKSMAAAMDKISDYLKYVSNFERMEIQEEYKEEKKFNFENMEIKAEYERKIELNGSFMKIEDYISMKFLEYLIAEAWEVEKSQTIPDNFKKLVLRERKIQKICRYQGYIIDKQKREITALEEKLNQQARESISETSLSEKSSIAPNKENGLNGPQIVGLSEVDDEDDEYAGNDPLLEIMMLNNKLINDFLKDKKEYKKSWNTVRKECKKQNNEIVSLKRDNEELKKPNGLLYTLYIPVCAIVGGVCGIVIWWRCSQK